MKEIYTKIIMVFTCMFIAVASFATHNRAGEITYVQLDELTIRATITTYTKTSSQAADRDSLIIMWGDGTSEYVARDNGSGTPLPNDVKVNYYTATHTYPGRATYTMSVEDPNRIQDILNIPGSIDVRFYIETTFTFLNPQFEGFNNSPILLQPPIDFACVGRRFVHNPNAFDPDGDSLAYELIVPLQAGGQPILDYSYPDEINPGPNNMISLDETTGDFVWDAPQIQGEYNIAILIKEYRSGVLINKMIRDMQIFVETCDNEPPKIESEDLICVVAGDTINEEIFITDPDQGQLISVSASGGPFVIPNSNAIFIVEPGFVDPPVTANFYWETNCNNISNQEYQIVFRAVDNFFGDTSGLADLKTMRIKIVGPPPENLEAETNSGEITLTWDLPYSCEETLDDYFQGFSVWRKEGSNTFPLDSCSPGLEGKGYEIVNFNTRLNNGEKYFFIDTDVERGVTYCYRILAEFAQTSMAGNPFNRVESLPSNEVCIQLSRDLPLITAASIETTDSDNGKVFVEWTKPLPQDLDTIENPGPYRYVLSRSEGIGSENFVPVPGADYTIQNFSDPVDTSFIDDGLNTRDQGYTYDISFFVTGSPTPFDKAASASSVFLNVEPSDHQNQLTWETDVPWQNYEFDIFRFNELTMDFDSIGSTTMDFYVDENLENGTEYCYKVRTVGSYGITGIRNPLLNFSQEKCGSPVDNIAPCAPELMVKNICNEADQTITEDQIVNELSWNNPDEGCEDLMDVFAYNIYYSPIEGGEYQLVETIEGAEIMEYDHRPENGVSGCYVITSLDSLGNESEFSNFICVDNCPVFKLPNVFTPNNDGSNDLYVPTLHRFIDRIELNVFSRWGTLVFETSDPQINWNGTNKGGKDLAEGVYYYTCVVYERRVDGVSRQPEVLKGFIHIVR